MSRILLVEDDNILGATLKENLELDNYSVDWLQTGARIIEKTNSRSYDLIILDVMLPIMTGLEALTIIRQTSQIPVMMISAKGAARDRIHGLSLEADDYLTKPFHLKEFLLRVRSLLKRASRDQNLLDSPITIGRACFDLKAFTVKAENGDKETLGAKEVKLLSLLISKSNTVVSREEIISTVWEKNESPSTRTIDNFIVKLRKLIEQDPSDPKCIVSHRGVGYSLRKDI